MSGGFFDYKQYGMSDDVLEIQKLIDENNVPDDYGYARNYSNDTIAKFQEAKETLDKAAKMLQRIDWLVSGDDGEDSFHKRWDEDGI